MKKFKRIMFFVLLGVALYIGGYKINSDIREIQWHNAGHSPTFNGELMEKSGDYFIAKSDKFSAYVSVDFIEANKYCKICEAKESLLYKATVYLGIINEKKDTTKEHNDFCEHDYGITAN